jgi:tellurite resistance protein
MHDQDAAIIKALVPVAWADGVFADSEKEMIEALFDAYRATDKDRAELRAYAAERKTLDDIDLQELSADDRRVLLQHAVLLTFADGCQSAEERAMIEALAKKLKLPEAEAQELIASSAQRARSLLYWL